jgi:hypothetical protein
MRAMLEVAAHLVSPLVVPYALWPEGDEPQAHAALWSSPAAPELPHLQAWLKHAPCVSQERLSRFEEPSLSMPHETVVASQLGWPRIDGLLPWAAQVAVQKGLARAGDGSAWGWVSLCHWQVSHGSATLTDPADLNVDDATDAALFQTMHTFFAEDGLTLHRHQPGQWLVQSPSLAHVPTASIDRVIGDDVDAWLVGNDGGVADAAQVKLWRRLQNEMQMLLYTHPVNAQRQVPVNSFWLHGTGALPAQVASGERRVAEPSQPAALSALRRAYLSRDFRAWSEAWRALDTVFAVAEGSPHAVVLCGAHEVRCYQRGATGVQVAAGAAGAGWRQALARLPQQMTAWLTGQSAHAGLSTVLSERRA